MTYSDVRSTTLQTTTDPMARITHFRDVEVMKRCSLYPFPNPNYSGIGDNKRWHLTCCRMKAGIGLSSSDYNSLSA